ncbi:MAG: glycosyltransferase family 4 protein [bacterium]
MEMESEKKAVFKKQTVFIDARLMFYAGVGRYLRELVYNICEIDRDISFYLLGDKKKLAEFIESDKSGVLSMERFTLLDSRAKKYSFGEQFTLHYFFMKYSKKVDLFFCPHFNVPLFYLPKNSVVTVHDLTFFKFPSYFGNVKTFIAKILLKRTLKKAKKIIAVSNFVKEDIITMFGTDDNFTKILEDKITVIYQGLGKNFAPVAEDETLRFKTEKNLGRYILYCGNRKKHKNITGLLKAFDAAKKDLPGIKLAIIGSKFKDYDFVDKYIEENNIRDIVQLKDVSDYELRLYYGSAEAFVFFSLSEGFGFAPLEAASCGAPLILSSAAALPEVFAGAAVFVDPYDIADMAGAIRRVVSNKSLREELKGKSLGLAGKYSYTDTAAKTIEVFKEITE